MYTRPLAGLSLAATLVIAGCAQDQKAAAPLPTEASFATAPAGCSYSVARSAAKAYFASSRDPVFDLLSAMSDAQRTSGIAAATTAGFAVLDRIADAADLGTAAVKGTPAQGSTAVNAVLSCMSVTGHSYIAPIDFAPSLNATGLFAVRGGSEQAAVVSRGLDDRSMPLFGAEKTGATFHSTVSPILFYGYERPADFTTESAAGAVFELSTLPSGLTFSPPIRAGVCSFESVGARILHEHSSVDVILPPAGLPSFCVAVTASRGLSSVMQLAASWLLPATLQASAAAPASFDGGGGLLSGLSPVGAFTFTATLSFEQQPTNSSVSKAPPQEQFSPIIKVKAVSAKGTPLKGVTITLAVVGNSGSFTPPSANTAVTGADGIASFPDYYLDKAGGYTLEASAGEFSVSVLSAQFNINGQ